MMMQKTKIHGKYEITTKHTMKKAICTPLSPVKIQVRKCIHIYKEENRFAGISYN
jgi:hypothetical protein